MRPDLLQELRRVCLALAGALVLAALLTWPMVLRPTEGLVGHPGNDTWNHVWGYWWVAEGLANDGTIPMSTPLLNHPRGGTLFFIDSFNAVLSAPIQWTLGLVAAFNAVVIGSLAWNAFGAWLLARYVLRDDLAAILPAALYGSSAHVLGQTYNGITETINTGWIPIYLLTLCRLLDRPRISRGLALGAALAVCATSNFYYGLFGALLSVVVVAHRAVTAPRQVRWGAFVLSTILGAALFGGLVAPTLTALSATISADDAMVTRDPAFVWASLLNHNMTDLVSSFRPGANYSPDLKALYGEDLLIITYLGWVMLALAVAGLVLWRPRRELSLWVWIALVFWVFSLGPYLHVAGEYVTWDGRKIPLPFLPFFEAFPLFSRISHPFRFVVPATLGLGILAGFGAKALAARVSLPQGVVVGAATALALGEVLLLSPAPWPLPRCEAKIPAAYASLPEDGAVLDLPITVPNLERAVYTYYQTAHGRPSPYGLNDPLPDPLERNPLTWMLIQVEASRAIDLPPVMPELELIMGARLLSLEGYRAIVVHESLYPEHKRRMVRALLDGIFGPPLEIAEDDVALYTLPALEPAGEDGA